MGRLRAGIALALVLVGSVALAYPVLAYGLNGDRTRRLTAAVEAAIRSSQAANRARAGSNLVSGGVRARAPDRRARSEESEPAPADEGRAGGRPILEVPAPRGGQALGVIQIPAIGLHTVFLEGTADATLLVGPGHLPWTSMPGTGGVSVLAAHRDLQFSNLHDVDFGDRIWLELPSGTVTYKVVDVHVTTPRDGRIYAADPGRPTELRLLTCWPPSFIGPAPDRLVVSAVPVAAAPAPAPVLPTPAAASPEAGSPAAASSPAALASDEPPRAMAGGSRVHLPAAPTSVGAELVPMLGAAGVGLSSLASFARVQGRRRRAWFVAFLVGALALDVALVIGLAA